MDKPSDNLYPVAIYESMPVNDLYPPEGIYTVDQKELIRAALSEAHKSLASSGQGLSWVAIAGEMIEMFESAPEEIRSRFPAPFNDQMSVDMGGHDFLRLFTKGYPVEGGTRRYLPCNELDRLIAMDLWLTDPGNTHSSLTLAELHKLPLDPTAAQKMQEFLDSHPDPNLQKLDYDNLVGSYYFEQEGAEISDELTTEYSSCRLDISCRDSSGLLKVEFWHLTKEQAISEGWIVTSPEGMIYFFLKDWQQKCNVWMNSLAIDESLLVGNSVNTIVLLSNIEALWVQQEMVATLIQHHWVEQLEANSLKFNRKISVS